MGTAPVWHSTSPSPHTHTHTIPAPEHMLHALFPKKKKKSSTLNYRCYCTPDLKTGISTQTSEACKPQWGADMLLPLPFPPLTPPPHLPTRMFQQHGEQAVVYFLQRSFPYINTVIWTEYWPAIYITRSVWPTEGGGLSSGWTLMTRQSAQITYWWHSWCAH